jgi:hypothetical protein
VAFQGEGQFPRWDRPHVYSPISTGRRE